MCRRSAKTTKKFGTGNGSRNNAGSDIELVRNSIRALYVTAKNGNEPLDAKEISERMKPLFDNLIADPDTAAEMYESNVRKYTEFFKKQGWPLKETLENMRQRWTGALVVHGWNDDAENEKFSAILYNKDNFILEFYEKLSWPFRRRIAKLIAEAIDNDFALGEEW